MWNLVKGMYMGKVAAGILAGIFLFATLWAVFQFERVDPGNVGILIDYGKERDQLGQAAHELVPTGSYKWVGPRQKLVEYPISQQTLTMSGDQVISCRDKNSIQVGTDITVLYRVDPAQAAQLFFKRPNLDISSLEESILKRDTRSVVERSCYPYSYEELYGAKKAEISSKIAADLAPIFAESFIIIDRVALGETHLAKAQQDALDAKALAIQEAERAQSLKTKAEYEAAAKVAEADGARKVAEIQAQAAADAKIQAAEADKKAFDLLVQALGGPDNYLRWLEANKWDGKLPTTNVGGEVPVIVNPKP